MRHLDTAGKHLMVIGGRWSPEPLVQAAKDLGCWVLATHYSRSITAIPGADATINLNPRNDIERVAALARFYGIEAIVADSDDNALYACGVLTKRFGLPGPAIKAVEFSTNKKLLRNKLRENGIPQPEFCFTDSVGGIRDAAQSLGGPPLIVKPLDGQTGAGVIKIENTDEVEDAFRETMAKSKTRECIVERFIDGAAVNVTGLTIPDGEHIVLLAGSKKTMPGKRPLTSEILYPTNADSVLVKEAAVLHKAAVAALGYNFGLAHSEILVDRQNKLWLIESTNRGEGSGLSTLALPAATDLPINRWLVELALGKEKEFTLNEPLSTGKTAILIPLKLGDGENRMKKLPNMDLVRAMDGMLDCSFFYGSGDIVPKNDRRIGRFIIAADTAKDAEDLAVKASRILRVELAIRDGQNM